MGCQTLVCYADVAGTCRVNSIPKTAGNLATAFAASGGRVPGEHGGVDPNLFTAWTIFSSVGPEHLPKLSRIKRFRGHRSSRSLVSCLSVPR